MNVLILGLGSIGQRHLRNLRAIDKNIKFFTLRRKYVTPFLNNKNQVNHHVECNLFFKNGIVANLISSRNERMKNERKITINKE